jgi:hypothetical protein
MIQTPYSDITERILAAFKASQDADTLLAEYQTSIRETMLNLRSRSGLTAKAFGALAGVSKAYIYSLEKGVRIWNKPLVEKICQSIQP